MDAVGFGPLNSFIRLSLAAVLSVTGLLWKLKAADVLPRERNGNWKAGVNVGIPNGIPTNRTKIVTVTEPPFNADSTGATDASTAINNAIQSAPADSIVFLPPGVYRLNSQISLRGRSNLTLRGSGDSTILDVRCGGQSAVYAGSDTQWPNDYTSGGSIVSGDLGQGSAIIEAAQPSQFSVGDIVILTEDNDLTLPVVDVLGKPRARGQLTRIVQKNGDRLQISPTLYWRFDANRSPRMHKLKASIYSTGIENLKIDLTNSTVSFGIWLQQAVRSWIDRVTVVKSSNYGIYLLYAFECEIRHSVVDDRKTKGSNGAGILVERSTANLIEDNILARFFPHIEVNFMSTGNVFAYNLCVDSSINGAVGVSIGSNHGAHNSFNLYEGNVAPNLQADGYYGSVSEDTVFRNWLHGTSPGVGAPREPILLQRFTRNYSVIGNLLGTAGMTYVSIVGKRNDQPYVLGLPNMGNASYNGTAQLSRGQRWSSWQALLDNAISTIPFDSRFQELDLDVKDTLILKENYDYALARIPSNESLPAADLPPSYYRSSKPNWFGQLPWPAFDPRNPDARIDAIPAGYRYLHGRDAPGVVVNLPPSAPSNLNAK